MAKFEKGKSGNPQGKQKGTINRTTKEAKKLFNSILNNEIDNIKDSFDKVRNESPYRYLMLLSKYLNYVYPKGLELNIEDNREQPLFFDLSDLTNEKLIELSNDFKNSENKQIIFLPESIKRKIEVFIED